MPLALSASITLEQSYGGVDGDSASSTELYALVSSLAGLEVRQDVAVTGSVDQHGNVQAVGGVNEKIEGFFDVCVAQGLTGTQGVMLPTANVDHLMLREDVAEAIDGGRFHVWSVDTIDAGLELLTGCPAGEPQSDGRWPEDSVWRKVSDRLTVLAERAREFSRR
jgi:predicted ATP-dependent protease